MGGMPGIGNLVFNYNPELLIYNEVLSDWAAVFVSKVA